MKKLFIALLIAAATYGLLDYWGNLHTLEPGVAYRSAQLSSSRLETVIEDLGIKSVLNLRGNTGSQWYKDETQVCDRLGVEHVSWKLSALRRVPPVELDMILVTLEAMPKPVLIHCQGGADRTGLVSAAWMYSEKGVSPEEAESQLSPLYGHLPFLGNGTVAMDKSFRRFVERSEEGQVLLAH